MPPYRLQTLLDIRIRAEEEAKEAFSKAVKAHEAEKKKHREMVAELEKRKVERKAKVQAFLVEMTAKGGGISAFQQMNRFEQRLKDEEAHLTMEIARQLEAVDEAAKMVEQRRLEMAEAATEKKAIEKHRENWQAEVRKERMAKEELNQDEIGQTLHLARVRAATRKPS